MSGLRFCMVTTFYPPFNFGGDGIGVQRLSSALARRGHRVTVLQDVDAFNVLNSGPEPDGDNTEDGVEVVRLRNSLGKLSVLLTHQTGRPVLNAPAIKRFFSERQFDVINFHNVSLVGGPGILKYGDALRLYMAHEHWLVCPTHVLWRHKRERCTGKQCFRCSIYYRRPPQLWRYTKHLQRQLKYIDSFIAMSEFSRDKHREFGFSRDMEVVNYFLPSKVDNVVESRSPHERPYFLFVGRLERIKGLDDVIPIFNTYRDADLLVAGDGEYGPILRRLAAGVEGVKFLGRISPQQLEQYYRHALALIVPSVCYETFGIILIEAFRQSTPVLARRLGPFPEIVERCGGGLLFTDADELRSAMRRLQDDELLRSRLSEAGHNGFETYWSEAAVIPRYLDVVRRTARSKGRQDIVRVIEAQLGAGVGTLQS